MISIRFRKHPHYTRIFLFPWSKFPIWTPLVKKQQLVSCQARELTCMNTCPHASKHIEHWNCATRNRSCNFVGEQVICETSKKGDQ
jgi:hypothetical protein